MAKIEIELPPMGEGITEATITKILKNTGDFVEEDEAIIEIATDKVDSEITAPEPGTIEKFLFAEGDDVPIGSIIAILNTEKQETTTAKEKKQEAEKIVEAQKVKLEKTTANKETTEDEKNILFINKTPTGKFISPLVRNIANKEGISLKELDNISGNGEEGRITKADILDYIKNKSQKEKILETKLSQQKTTTKVNQQSGSVEIIEMDRMRKLIAEHMVNSKQTSAHVTSFIEVDVTNMVMWRNKVKSKGCFFEKIQRKNHLYPYFY